MRDSVPSARYFRVCNVLRLWRIWLITTYKYHGYSLRVAVKLSALGRVIRISERARVRTDLARHNTPV